MRLRSASLLITLGLSLGCSTTTHVTSAQLAKAKPSGRDGVLVIKEPRARIDALSTVRFVLTGGRVSPWFDADQVWDNGAEIYGQRAIDYEDIDTIVITKASAQALARYKGVDIPRLNVRPGRTEDEHIVEVGPYFRRWIAEVYKDAMREVTGEQEVCLDRLDEDPPKNCVVRLSWGLDICWSIKNMPATVDASRKISRASHQAYQEIYPPATRTTTPPSDNTQGPEYYCEGYLDTQDWGQWSSLSSRWGMFTRPSSPQSYYDSVGSSAPLNVAIAPYPKDQIERIEIYELSGAKMAPWLLLSGGLAAFASPFVILPYPDKIEPTSPMTQDALIPYSNTHPNSRNALFGQDGFDALFDFHTQLSLGITLNGTTMSHLYAGFIWLHALEIGGGLLLRRPSNGGLEKTGFFRFTGNTDLDAARRWTLSSGVELGGGHWRLLWSLGYNPTDNLILTVAPLNLVGDAYSGKTTLDALTSFSLGLRF